MIAAGMFLCMAFLWACAKGQDGKTDLDEVERADYIFPDVRGNNVPIGKFMEIYFFDTVTIGGSSTAGMVVVAAYDVKGETCYDTRIYRWDGTGYSAEGKLMQEFNEKYYSKEEYPVEELYHLSSLNISG